MTADETGLLSDILSNPDDDAPRLIYADWLEDYGDADRAEFIRLQCGSGLPLPREDGPTPLAKYSREVALLLGGGGRRWVAGLAVAFGLTKFGHDHGMFSGEGSLSFIWRRGFVESIEATAAMLMREGVLGRVFTLHPVCRMRAIDRTPTYQLFRGTVGYSWLSRPDQRFAAEPQPYYVVPASVRQYLSGEPASGGYAWYPTINRAKRDLDRTWVQWGRSQAAEAMRLATSR